MPPATRRKKYIAACSAPSANTLRVRRWRSKGKQLKGLTTHEVGQSNGELHDPSATSAPPELCPRISEEENVCSGAPVDPALAAAFSTAEDISDEMSQYDLDVHDCGGTNEFEVPPVQGPLELGHNSEEQCNSAQDEPLEKLKPLCDHTDCSPDDVMLMCLTLGRRHNLTWAAIEDIFKMFNAIYGKKIMTTSKTSLMKRLFDVIDETKVDLHYYCKSCSQYVSKMGNGNEIVVCDCGSELSGKGKETYFATISLKDQVKNLFETNERLAEAAMTYRFSRVKVHESNLEDIYDGSDYKAHAEPGKILSFAHNFSYSFFTDGVGKSKKSFWPIYVSINELPPKDRKNNILIVGLYHGDGAPNLKMFLKPFVDEANKLSSDGFDWVYKGKSLNSKIIPLMCICDADARYKLLNMKSHKAFYGCTYCYVTQTRTTKRLKFVITNKKIVERTKESHQEDVARAFANARKAEEKRHGRSVLGTSCVVYLNFFNQNRGMPVDYMHTFLIGVVKTYFENLFMEGFKKFWVDEDTFTPGDIQAAINKRLLEIKPPSCISRTPRSIAQWNNWKANEWRTFLLFYLLPCLKGILKDEQLQHLALLSLGTCILLQKTVSIENAHYVHRLFQLFTFKYQTYFGEEFMYYNIHQLIHVVSGVLKWGPIFTHNAFMYESFNRNLLQYQKNPYRVVKEVANKYVLMQALPRLLTQLACSNTLNYCEEFLDHNLATCVDRGSCAVLGAGSILNNKLTDEEKTFLVSHFPSSVCLFYERILYRGNRITTRLYAENKKNNDSVISTLGGEIQEVKAIFSIADQSVRLLTRQVLLDDCSIVTEPYLSHIFEVTGYGNLKIIEPQEVSGPCFFMEIPTGTYLSKMPYGCYGD